MACSGQNGAFDDRIQHTVFTDQTEQFRQKKAHVEQIFICCYCFLLISFSAHFNVQFQYIVTICKSPRIVEFTQDTSTNNRAGPSICTTIRCRN